MIDAITLDVAGVMTRPGFTLADSSGLKPLEFPSADMVARFNDAMYQPRSPISHIPTLSIGGGKTADAPKTGTAPVEVRPAQTETVNTSRNVVDFARQEEPVPVASAPLRSLREIKAVDEKPIPSPITTAAAPVEVRKGTAPVRLSVAEAPKTGTAPVEVRSAPAETANISRNGTVFVRQEEPVPVASAHLRSLREIKTVEERPITNPITGRAPVEVRMGTAPIKQSVAEAPKMGTPTVEVTTGAAPKVVIASVEVSEAAKTVTAPVEGKVVTASVEVTTVTAPKIVIAPVEVSEAAKTVTAPVEVRPAQAETVNISRSDAGFVRQEEPVPVASAPLRSLREIKAVDEKPLPSPIMAEAAGADPKMGTAPIKQSVAEAPKMGTPTVEVTTGAAPKVVIAPVEVSEAAKTVTAPVEGKVVTASVEVTTVTAPKIVIAPVEVSEAKTGTAPVEVRPAQAETVNIPRNVADSVMQEEPVIASASQRSLREIKTVDEKPIPSPIMAETAGTDPKMGTAPVEVAPVEVAPKTGTAPVEVRPAQAETVNISRSNTGFVRQEEPVPVASAPLRSLREIKTVGEKPIPSPLMAEAAGTDPKTGTAPVEVAPKTGTAPVEVRPAQAETVNISRSDTGFVRQEEPVPVASAPLRSLREIKAVDEKPIPSPIMAEAAGTDPKMGIAPVEVAPKTGTAPVEVRPAQAETVNIPRNVADSVMQEEPVIASASQRSLREIKTVEDRQNPIPTKGTAPKIGPEMNEPEAGTIQLQAVDGLNVAATVAAPVQPPTVEIVIDPAMATARTHELVEAASDVADAIMVTPSLVRGDGNVKIFLKPTVLDGSQIQIEAKGTSISIEVAPATPTVAAIVERSRAQFEQSLSERLPSFQFTVRVSGSKKSKMEGDL